MTNLMKRIHDAQTGEIIDREMTADEMKEYESLINSLAVENNAIAKSAADKEALLAKLGITADEFNTLLGGN